MNKLKNLLYKKIILNAILIGVILNVIYDCFDDSYIIYTDYIQLLILISQTRHLRVAWLRRKINIKLEFRFHSRVYYNHY